ncbi:MAG: response regulator [Candidatus Omnitrophica bacterium]|nr:response regulator [Candidatus Omnitrophota bacterium]
MEKKKILIIDDEVNLADLVKARLEFNNFYVIPCYTSSRALEIALRENPDLILLDVMMPDPDGYEVCKSLKADKATSTIPIILFTAKEQQTQDLRDKCLEVGADDYILKPYGQAKLLAKINKLIGTPKKGAGKK